MKGFLEYTEDQVVSTDFLGSTSSSILMPLPESSSHLSSSSSSPGTTMSTVIPTEWSILSNTCRASKCSWTSKYTDTSYGQSTKSDGHRHCPHIHTQTQLVTCAKKIYFYYIDCIINKYTYVK